MTLLIPILVGALGMAMKLVGWREWQLAIDEMPFADDAIRLIEHGVIPFKGSILSMGAYSTPLSAWIYVPGTLLLDDPDLTGLVGTGLLFIGTVAGIYRLAARLGAGCALLASALFAFSKVGQHFAGFSGAWAFFVVWTAYFAARWAAERDGRPLAWAVLVWGIGLYNSLVLMPLGVFLVVVWLWFRPPVALRPLAAVLSILVVVWLPYLVFDARHGFENLAGQILQRTVIPADFERTWCDPTLRPIFEAQIGGLDLAGQPRPLPFEGWLGLAKKLGIAAAARASTVETALIGNLRLSIPHPVLAEVVALTLAFAILAAVGYGLGAGRGGRLPRPVSHMLRSIPSAWFTAVGLASVSLGLVLNELVVVRFLSRDGHLWDSEVAVIRQFQVVAGLVGLALIFRRPLGRVLAGVFARLSAGGTGGDAFARVLSLAYLVPTIVLVLLGAPGRDRYFNLVWPIETVLLAMFAVHLLPRLMPTKWSAAAGGALVLILLAGAGVSGKVQYVLERGYAGQEPPLERAVRFLGDTLRSEGRSEAAIAYHVPFGGYNAAYNVIDSRYKVGAVEDFRLRRQFGIENADRCAEGFRAGDEFLIAADPPPAGAFAAYAPPPERGYETLARFDGYRVARRAAAGR